MAVDINPPLREHWDDLHASLIKRGLFINLLLPFVLMAAAYLMRKAGLIPEAPVLDEAIHRLLLYGFGAASLFELGVAIYLRKIRFSPARFADFFQSFAAFADRCMTAVIPIFAISAAPVFYGFILYVLGGTIEQFIFFILVSLIGFRFVRPSRDALEKLWTDLGGATE